jgi:hypothetical protein
MFALALHDFSASRSDELSFEAGNLIKVLRKAVDDGWWEGEIADKNGKISSGYFPDIYVEIVPKDRVPKITSPLVLNDIIPSPPSPPLSFNIAQSEIMESELLGIKHSEAPKSGNTSKIKASDAVKKFFEHKPSPMNSPNANSEPNSSSISSKRNFSEPSSLTIPLNSERIRKSMIEKTEPICYSPNEIDRVDRRKSMIEKVEGFKYSPREVENFESDLEDNVSIGNEMFCNTSSSSTTDSNENLPNSELTSVISSLSFHVPKEYKPKLRMSGEDDNLPFTIRKVTTDSTKRNSVYISSKEAISSFSDDMKKIGEESDMDKQDWHSMDENLISEDRTTSREAKNVEKITLPKKSINIFSKFVSLGCEEFLHHKEDPNHKISKNISITQDQKWDCIEVRRNFRDIKIVDFEVKSTWTGKNIVFEIFRADDGFSVLRSVKQFKWLHSTLCAKFSTLCIPTLPELNPSPTEYPLLSKHLEMYLRRLCRNTVISSSSVFNDFLNCEEGPAWKTAKKIAELDLLKGAKFLEIIEANHDITNGNDPYMFNSFCRSMALDSGRMITSSNAFSASAPGIKFN